jgi:hypothetical protein
VEIVAALFIEDVNFRQVAGPSTRIDITGAYFSTRAETFPTVLTPHLLVLLRAESDEGRNGTLEVTFVRTDLRDEKVQEEKVHDDEVDGEVGRSRQPVYINPPGTFFRQLVRPELSFDAPGAIEARCVVPETGSRVTVPLTVLG